MLNETMSNSRGSDLTTVAHDVKLLLNRNGGSSRLSEFPKLWASNTGKVLDYEGFGYIDLRVFLNDLEGIFVQGSGNMALVKVLTKWNDETHTIQQPGERDNVKISREQLLEESWAALCSRCDSPFVIPVLLVNCCHIICKNCLRSAIRSQRGTSAGPTCPECGITLQKEHIKLSSESPGLYKLLHEVVRSPQMRCIKRDCQWIGTIEQYSQHVVNCKQKEGPDLSIDYKSLDPCFPSAGGKVAEADMFFPGLIESLKDIFADGEDPKDVPIRSEDRPRFMTSLRTPVYNDLAQRAAKERRETFLTNKC
eukprot:Selendium_serpulae@DN1916_c0_g1_i1.p1